MKKTIYIIITILIIIFPQLITASYSKIKYSKNSTYSYLYKTPIEKEYQIKTSEDNAYIYGPLQFSVPWDQEAEIETKLNRQIYKFSDENIITAFTVPYIENENFDFYLSIYKQKPGDYSFQNNYKQRWSLLNNLELKKYISTLSLMDGTDFYYFEKQNINGFVYIKNNSTEINIYNEDNQEIYIIDIQAAADDVEYIISSLF